METLEQIKADAVEVFHFDRECRPQDRAHAYLGKYRVRRGYNDTARKFEWRRSKAVKAIFGIYGI